MVTGAKGPAAGASCDGTGDVTTVRPCSCFTDGGISVALCGYLNNRTSAS